MYLSPNAALGNNKINFYSILKWSFWKNSKLLPIWPCVSFRDFPRTNNYLRERMLSKQNVTLSFDHGHANAAFILLQISLPFIWMILLMTVWKMSWMMMLTLHLVTWSKNEVKITGAGTQFWLWVIVTWTSLRWKKLKFSCHPNQNQCEFLLDHTMNLRYRITLRMSLFAPVPLAAHQ